MPSIILSESVSFSGKTAVVTGANAGLDFSASLHLLERGLKTLVVAVRLLGKGEAAGARLVEDPAVKGLRLKPQVLVYELDLVSLDSLKSFADKITAEVSQYETVFQVNYLSNALLSILLLPISRSSAGASDPPLPSYINIIDSCVQASNSFQGSPIPDSKHVLEYFNNKDSYKGLRQYNDTKPLVTMWARQLAMHLDPFEVVVNTLCPGLVQTDFDSHLPFRSRPMITIWRKVKGRTANLAFWVMVWQWGQ